MQIGKSKWLSKKRWLNFLKQELQLPEKVSVALVLAIPLMLLWLLTMPSSPALQAADVLVIDSVADLSEGIYLKGPSSYTLTLPADLQSPIPTADLFEPIQDTCAYVYHIDTSTRLIRYYISPIVYSPRYNDIFAQQGRFLDQVEAGQTLTFVVRADSTLRYEYETLSDQTAWTGCLNLRGKNCAAVCSERGMEMVDECALRQGGTACLQLWSQAGCQSEPDYGSYGCLDAKITGNIWAKCCCEGAEEQAAVASTEGFIINLYSGWNWISLPLEPEDPSVAAVFSGIEGKWSQIKTQTKGTVFTNSRVIGDLEEVHSGQGIQVLMLEPGEITVRGETPSSNTPEFEWIGPNNAGWTWFGVMGTEETKLTDLVDSQYILDLKSFDPSAQAELDLPLDSLLAPGKGYKVQLGLEAEADSGSPFGFHPASVLGAYTNALDIGITWTRDLGFIWTVNQPDIETDTYNFKNSDIAMASVPENINILSNLYTGTAGGHSVLDGVNYYDYGQEYSFLPRDDTTEKYLKWIKAVVERYDGDSDFGCFINDANKIDCYTKGDKMYPLPEVIAAASKNPIKHWQVNNEPDIKADLDGLSDFDVLQKITYMAIKEADPGSTVLIGGAAGGFGYYSEILTKLQGKYFDVFDYHWFRGFEDYREKDVRLDNNVEENFTIQEVRDFLDSHDYHGPIWITEMGTYSGTPEGERTQTESQQAFSLVRRYVHPLSEGVERIFWAYGLREGFGAPGNNDFWDSTGFIYDGVCETPSCLKVWPAGNEPPDGTKKLSYYTYKLMTEKLEGSDWGNIETVINGTDNVYAHKFTKDDKPIYVVWWDYWNEPNVQTKNVNLAVSFEGNAKIMKAVPNGSAGSELNAEDYPTFFDYEVKKLADGNLSFKLGDMPVYIEATDEEPEPEVEPLPDSLLHYSFNADANNSGTAEGYNGAASGVISVDGKFGKAYSFDGVNDHVSIARGPQLEKISVSLWAKPGDLTDGGILGKYDNIRHYVYAIWMQGGRLYFETGNYDTKWETKVSTPISAANEWLHIVGTYDGKNIRLYVNGEEKAVVAETRGLGYSSGPVCIGGVQYNCTSYHSYNEVNDYFKGIIDEVKIWDKALTADEVQKLFEGDQGGEPEPEPEPITGYLEPAEVITPVPKQIGEISNGMRLDEDWAIVADLNNQDDNFAAYYLQDEIEAEAGLTLTVQDISQGIGEQMIVIGDPEQNADLQRLAESLGIDTNITEGFEQGYVLSIDDKRILVLGDSEAGSFYGMISLSLLLKEQEGGIVLPRVRITDWPDLEIRGFHQFDLDKPSGGTRPGWACADIRDCKAWIKELAELKYNFNPILPRITTNTPEALRYEAQALELYLDSMHFYKAINLDQNFVAGLDENFYEGVFADDIAVAFDDRGRLVSQERPPRFENLDFELGLEGWEGAYWEIDCSNGCSAKYDSPDIGGDPEHQLRSISYPNPGGSYLVKFSAKVVLGRGASANRTVPQLKLVFDDNTTLIRNIDAIAENQIGEWNDYYLFVPHVNSGSVRIEAGFNKETKPVEFWLDDIELTPLGEDVLYNLIQTGDTSLVVRDAKTGATYTEGTDYTLATSGMLNGAKPLRGQQTIINPNQSLIGKKLSLDYDFYLSCQSSREEFVSFADPGVLTSYEENILVPTLQYLDPEFIFIRLDEITGFNRDSRSLDLEKSNAQLLASFANALENLIHRHDPNLKIYFWNDMFMTEMNGEDDSYQIPFGGQLGATGSALGSLDTDFVHNIWYYETGREAAGKMSDMVGEVKGHGSDFFVTPYNEEENIHNWSYFAKDKGALGLVGSTWGAGFGHLNGTAEYAWNAADELVDLSGGH